MAKSKKPIFYLARCELCNHYVYASGLILWKEEDKDKPKWHRIQGSARILKMKMAEHLSKSHNDSFKVSVPLSDFSECFDITRIRGEGNVKTLTKLMKNPRFWDSIRNQQKYLRIRLS